MVIVKFRSSGEHEDLLKKIRKMKKFTEDIEECLEDVIDDEMDYRGGSYRKEWDEEESMKGRYDYRRGRK